MTNNDVNNNQISLYEKVLERVNTNLAMTKLASIADEMGMNVLEKGQDDEDSDQSSIRTSDTDTVAPLARQEPEPEPQARRPRFARRLAFLHSISYLSQFLVHSCTPLSYHSLLDLFMPIYCFYVFCFICISNYGLTDQLIHHPCFLSIFPSYRSMDLIENVRT